MALKMVLEVSGGRELEIGDPEHKVFDAAGGRIGRALDCDWVLSNRYVSRHHATISCADGVFFIECVGENGVAVNDPQARLPRQRRHALRHGDRLFLDEYEISVAITDDSVAPPPLKALEDTDVLALHLPAEKPDGRESPPPRAAAGKSLRAPYTRISASAATVPGHDRSRSVDSKVPEHDRSWSEKPGAADHPIPPMVFSPPQEPEPEDLEDVGATQPLPRPDAWPDPHPFVVMEPSLRPVALPVPARAATPGFDVAQFLRGAGLDPQAISPEMSATLGQILRIAVQGLVDVLRARAEFKSQLRLTLTRVQSAQNNPLKFATNAEDALAALLRKRTQGYLSPVEAFEDALDDIRFHQMAMLAGMRAGFESITSRFDPQTLMEQCNRRGPAGLPRLGGKARYWDRYVELFDEMVSYPDAGFQRLYGDEFALAYEEQLEELKRSRINGFGAPQELSHVSGA